TIVVAALLHRTECRARARVEPQHRVEARAERVEIHDLGGGERELVVDVAAALVAAVGAARPVVVVRGGEVDGELTAGGDVGRARGGVVRRARRVRAVAVLVAAVAAGLGDRRAGGRAALQAGAGAVALQRTGARALAEADGARHADGERVVDAVLAVVVEAVADLGGAAGH